MATTTEPAGPTPWLWALFGLQAVSAIFFVADAALDILRLEAQVPFVDHDGFEYLISAALMLGVYGTWRHIQRMTRRNEHLQDQVRVASGEFAALAEERFTEWSLTPAERDVAILTLKGMSVAEIAGARGSAEGTVKAQSASLYRKAGVSGRMQLVTMFLDEMVAPLA